MAPLYPGLLFPKTFQHHYCSPQKYLLCLSTMNPSGSLANANPNSITSLSAFARFLWRPGLQEEVN